MIPLGGHDLCVHKGHHSCLPTLRPDGRALTLTDKVTDPQLKVHVVVQRWQKNDGKVITVIYGSHAAAIEEVVRNLVSEGPASRLINKH